MRNLDKDTKYLIGDSFVKIVHKGKAHIIPISKIRGEYPQVSKEAENDYQSICFWGDKSVSFWDFPENHDDLVKIFNWETITPRKIRKFIEENLSQKAVKSSKKKKNSVLRVCKERIFSAK